jgi:hypothetical protein
MCLHLGFLSDCIFFKPSQKRQELETIAERRTTILTWVGLGLMSVQFGILARLTWWEYSWDIMEPVTYFVTYGTAMAAYAYYVLTKQVMLWLLILLSCNISLIRITLSLIRDESVWNKCYKSTFIFSWISFSWPHCWNIFKVHCSIVTWWFLL